MLAPMVVGIGILGVEVPDDRPVFLATLAVHVAAGLICVVAGALAASAAKRPGRHPRAGTVYVWGLAVMFATATVLAGLRWRQDRHLFLIACVAFGLGATGWIAVDVTGCPRPQATTRGEGKALPRPGRAHRPALCPY